MKAKNRPLSTRLRVLVGSNIAIGPGKADVLAGIKETGSIAAAGRRMGMSYKRAWLLIETMNACFKEPVVATSRGGRAHGGAALTPTGERVLAGYRRMELLTRKAIAGELGKLKKLLRDAAKPK